jgi:hypothetical protein
VTSTAAAVDLRPFDPAADFQAVTDFRPVQTYDFYRKPFQGVSR